MYAHGGGGSLVYGPESDGVAAAPSFSMMSPMASQQQQQQQQQRSPITFTLKDMTVLGYLRGLAILGVLRALILTAAVVLLAIVLARVVNKNISFNAATSTGDGNRNGVPTTTTTSTTTAECLDLLCQLAEPPSYQCRRPTALDAGALVGADAWVVLGDVFASGSGGSASSSWLSQLMARAAAAASGTTTTGTTHLFNEAGPGIGQVANLTLQVAALRRDRTASALLAEDSTARFVVFVSVGQDATHDTLSETLGQMLESIWGGPDALVTTRNAHRFTIVLIVAPDPYWGDIEPSAAFRNDVTSTCGLHSWWQQKEQRRRVFDKLSIAAQRNNAVLIHLDRALGRFSLAGDGTAFEARCQPSSVSATPLYNTRGVFAAADVIWQCLEAPDATYDVPKMLAS